MWLASMGVVPGIDSSQAAPYAGTAPSQAQSHEIDFTSSSTTSTSAGEHDEHKALSRDLYNGLFSGSHAAKIWKVAQMFLALEVSHGCSHTSR